jgi:hypothetical protein
MFDFVGVCPTSRYRGVGMLTHAIIDIEADRRLVHGLLRARYV